MNAQVSINENSMVRTLAAGEDGAEIIKVTSAVNKIDAVKITGIQRLPILEHASIKPDILMQSHTIRMKRARNW